LAGRRTDFSPAVRHPNARNLISVPTWAVTLFLTNIQTCFTKLFLYKHFYLNIQSTLRRKHSPSQL